MYMKIRRMYSRLVLRMARHALEQDRQADRVTAQGLKVWRVTNLYIYICVHIYVI